MVILTIYATRILVLDMHISLDRRQVEKGLAMAAVGAACGWNPTHLTLSHAGAAPLAAQRETQ